MKTILLTILILLPVTVGHAQDVADVCITNRNAPPVSAYYWPPDTEVRVYLTHSMFTVEQRGTLFTAMKTWSAAASQTGAGVRFVYAGETEGLVSCQGCLTLTRRDVHKRDRKHYAFFNPMKQSDDG